MHMYTLTSQEHWTVLCDILATRLNTAGMHHAASLCYVCSGNVDAAVAYWARTAGGSAKVDALQVCEWGGMNACLSMSTGLVDAACSVYAAVAFWARVVQPGLRKSVCCVETVYLI